MRQKPEILAPCGSEESVRAAVNCGANAVYLGQQTFNARQNAVNFDRQAFLEIVAYCHLYGVKVYQTLNTLVFDSEISALERCIQTGCEAGIDAFIVQDMGVLSLVSELAPDVPIHASTQMTIHTPEGALFLERLGVKRVVLARELTLKEISEIRAASNIELEVFVHGALCVCVSGQCYMSGMLGGRSGNRGRCAQPCRLPFSVLKDGAADLSLKDLSAIDFLPLLEEAGVTSFKIEGRMKRPEYVAAAVTACVQKMRGEQPDIKQLQAIFSRSGFTNAYLENKRNKEMFGSRQKADVIAANHVLKPLQQLYHRPLQRVGVAANIRILPDKPVKLQMTDEDGNFSTAVGEVPEPAREKSLTMETVNGYLAKLGGTPFYLQKLEGIVADGLSLPAKSLNALRRICVEQLEMARKNVKEKRWIDRTSSLPGLKLPISKQGVWVRVEQAEQLKCLPAQKDVVVLIPIEKALSASEKLIKFDVILELPRVYFGKESVLKAQLVEAKEKGFSEVLVQNPAQINICRELGFDMVGGFGLNVTNSYSAEFYRKQGLNAVTVSFETNLEAARQIRSEADLGLIVYGFLPLMITRSCPLGKYRSCAECTGQGKMTDRQGKTFCIRCHNGIREIYNPDLLYLADRMREFRSFDFLVLYFTEESAEQVHQVVEEYRSGVGKREHLTRGLYYRNI